MNHSPTHPAPGIRICVATRARPAMLARCLESLGVLDTDTHELRGADIRILVVENDTEPHCKDVVEAAKSAMPFALEYALEPEPGIPHARNRLVDMAGACDWIAWVDDDEVVSPRWLAELVAAQAATGADAVMGPVLPTFETEPPHWLRPAFEHWDFEDHELVAARVFWSCNTLVRRESLDTVRDAHGHVFDPAFARTGGSDGMLGARLGELGARFAWAARAVVTEHIPATRATAGWHVRRRYRYGVNAAMRARRQHGAAGIPRSLAYAVGLWGKGALIVLACLGMHRAERFRALCYLAYGAGVLAGLCGGRFHEYDTIHGQ